MIPDSLLILGIVICVFVGIGLSFLAKRKP